MIPVGYMAKRVSIRPDWLKSERIVDVYSVSGCISNVFADYIKYWKHNGFWFFDSPAIIRELAKENSIDLNGTRLFYYEAYPEEFDAEKNAWMRFEPEASLETQVEVPFQKVLEGYDVVTFSTGTTAECSPLSCNNLATEIETNSHCLLTSLEQARQLLNTGKFKNSEPGPYRIFAVYSVEWDR
ncbi:MAG: hypothetical protein HZB51_18220 [Chloroflexi bacterium]|nr:hypothetical protein [Chloroflexota bacterium]